jgi:hypothetical protein
VVGYKHFEGPCFTIKMEAARSSKTLVSYHNIMWQNNPEHINLNSIYVRTANKSCEGVTKLKYMETTNTKLN